MTLTHNLGFPRIGAQRELKFALEAYWRGDLEPDALDQIGRELRQRHWRQQADAGLDFVTVGDFSWYDTVLDMTALLGAVPSRFSWQGSRVDRDTLFRMARGRAPQGEPALACEMTKWFDTNYHYIVPELHAGQHFQIASDKLFDEVREARAAGHRVKPVLLGPLSWLWLGKSRQAGFDKLELLDALVPVYSRILERLGALDVEWVQIDEPILALDLPPAWRQAFEASYAVLGRNGPKRLLTTYFGPLRENLQLACGLPVDGLHVDAVRGRGELEQVADWLADHKVLSVGIIDGRNVWRGDLTAHLACLERIRVRRGQPLWLAPSCSLLHVPIDLRQETELDPGIRNWLAFAVQKLEELTLLRTALDQGVEQVAEALAENRAAVEERRRSERIHRPAVQQRLAALTPEQGARRTPYAERARLQQERLRLPRFPTTTIGSFPQTSEIRTLRQEHRQGKLDTPTYTARLREEVDKVIRWQEDIGLDVLVHGEAERNDMVEYFGEQLEGFAITRHGWVQSYGSRCVKPPILYGDVSRPAPITVEWIRHAQSRTRRPVKGMLTGPVTILNWSFVRDDQPRSTTAWQLALALRDEVQDLEQAGIRIIQIDEAALREGLPLRRSEQAAYLEWAVQAFRLTASGVDNGTQIHTHMCYADFNDIIDAIAAMDADVITIESSRSRMELLQAFEDFEYPNAIGPGVYDIHSPNIPEIDAMVHAVRAAARHIDPDRLWVNPDCGLKTRSWAEVEPALRNMVEAARRLRNTIRGA